MKTPIAAIGFFLFSLVLPVKAWAAAFSQMYVFGDSLSDTGNLFNLTGSPPSPYFNGRISNGPNWIDYLSEDLGLDPITYTSFLGGAGSPTQGINFAFTGATTGTANTIVNGLPGLQQQIGFFNNYIQTNTPATDALYIVWAGGNDYFPTTSSFVPFTDPTTPVNNLSFAVQSLATVGARNILVVNLPNLGDTPLLNDTPVSDSFNTLAQAHNSSLNTTIGNLRQSLGSGVNLFSLDVNSLFSDAINNPANYGFTNVTDACIDNVQCVTDPNVQNQYLFWDQIHPTTVAHELVAQQALEEVPEPTFVLGMVTFATFLGGRKLLQGKSKK